MGLTSGVIGAVGAVMITWPVTQLVAQNLPGAKGVVLTLLVLGVAIITGFLAGSSVGRRVRWDRAHLVPYAVVAGSVAGVLTGCVLALTTTGAYLTTYASWPSGRLDELLVLLAYPIFALSGMFLGALAGGLSGLVGGACLRLLVPAR